MREEGRFRFDVEDHHGKYAPCRGQWCCGCKEHPAGKPWGWNWKAWSVHYDEMHDGLVSYAEPPPTHPSPESQEGP